MALGTGLLGKVPLGGTSAAPVTAKFPWVGLGAARYWVGLGTQIFLGGGFYPPDKGSLTVTSPVTVYAPPEAGVITLTGTP